MTHKEYQKERRRVTRKELKEIEGKLHPCPTFDGYEILHEHRGGVIVFSAWKGDNKLKEREVLLQRIGVLATPGSFYEANEGLFLWLVRGV